MEDLYNKLESYNKQNYCPMHMPGHKRNTKMLGNKLPYNIDITEIDGFDDLHNPQGVIKEIEEKAKRLYNSKRSFILVNGSTCGILAGIRAVVKSGDKILVARNCHKSVYNAIELNCLEPIYLKPNINKYGIEEEISVKEVQKKIEQNKDIKLIVITSPTYEGIISNISEIVKMAHEYSIPVLVDEAHGAHLNFIDGLRQYEALNAGADIVIQSLHKTLPALTQTAIMHIKGEFINENKIKTQLAIFETSSPSYILMSSIQECLNILEKQGKDLFETYLNNLESFYKETKKLEKLRILGNIVNKNTIYDKGKIVVITKGTNLTGKELSKILRENYKIEVEMSSINYIIAMTSICDSKENFERLAKALQEIDKQLSSMDYEETNYIVEIPDKAKGINEAIFSTNEKVIDIREAEGKASKEYVWVYPPGIPIITPGEIFDKNIIKKLLDFEGAKIEVRTSSGQFPNVIIID